MADSQQTSFDSELLRTAKGGGYVAFGKIFAQGSRFVTGLILARLMGAEQFGLYNLALTVATVAAGISLLGMDSAMVRFIAIMRSRQNFKSLWGTLQIGLGSTLLVSFLLSTGLFALAYPVSETIFHDPRLAPLIQLAAVFVPFLVLSDVLSGATRGFKNMTDMVIAQNIVQPTVRLLLVVVLAISDLSVPEAIVAFGLADGAAVLLLFIFLNKRFSLRRSFKEGHRDPRAVFVFSLPLWISSMMSMFRGNIQTMLLGSLNTIRGVGVFAVASQVTLVTHVFHYSITLAARPLIAELHDREDKDQMAHLYAAATKWVVTLNLPLFLIIVLFPAQLLAVFGESYIGGTSALVILAFADLINIGTGMCGAMIEMTGYSNLRLFNSVVQLVTSIVLNLLLIPQYGLVGAAIAAFGITAVANLLPLIEIWVLFRMLPYNRDLIKPVVAGLVAILLSFTLRNLLPPDSGLVFVALHALLILTSYTAVIFLLGLTKEERAILTHLRRRTAQVLSKI